MGYWDNLEAKRQEQAREYAATVAARKAKFNAEFVRQIVVGIAGVEPTGIEIRVVEAPDDKRYTVKASALVAGQEVDIVATEEDCHLLLGGVVCYNQQDLAEARAYQKRRKAEVNALARQALGLR